MSKKLVAYFSASGATEQVAKMLAEAVKADLYQIKPAVIYTLADLNWNDKKSRSSLEMNDPASRPELADKNADVESYDVIFIGFPIWWYVASHLINTFLESYDFSGKTVVLFATSGGSGFGKTIENLKGSMSATTIIKEGGLLNTRMSKDEMVEWVNQLGVE
ncbi:MAG: flavodoxin [Acetobacterium sp. MES1]|uniref:flavodoxin n=1 Tax=Acetobacterium sp. MES1 TaxID=1899015 RepID=UPI000B9CFC0A|nr:flavodoxin [Acetobacterium sp. MES1]OXS26714.1 MAG: flavodoxin [Acetobacterium sp. MES1]